LRETFFYIVDDDDDGRAGKEKISGRRQNRFGKEAMVSVWLIILYSFYNDDISRRDELVEKKRRNAGKEYRSFRALAQSGTEISSSRNFILSSCRMKKKRHITKNPFGLLALFP